MHQTARSRTRRAGWFGPRLLGTTAAVSAASLFLGGTVAVADEIDATGVDSAAHGHFLWLDGLGLDVAGAATAYSDNSGTAPDEDSDSLNLEVLGGLADVSLGTLSLPLIKPAPDEAGLLDLGVLGAVESYAASPSEYESFAASGLLGEGGALDLSQYGTTPGDPAELDLSALVRQLLGDAVTDELLNDASITLGAVGSQIESGSTGITSSYRITDLDASFTSPALGDAAGLVNDVLGEVLAPVQALLAPGGGIETLVSGAVGAIDALDVSLVLTVDATLNELGIDTAPLATTVTNELLAAPIDNSTATTPASLFIDLNTGTISVDLGQLLLQSNPAYDDLNDLPANTELLSSAVINAVTEGVLNAVTGTGPNSLTTKLVNAINDGIYDIPLTIDLRAAINVIGVIELANAPLTLDTTLGGLLGVEGYPAPAFDTSAVEVAGIPAGTLLDPLLGILTGLVSDLAGPLAGAVTDPDTGLLATLQPTINGVLNPIVTELIDVALRPVLEGVADITINAQPAVGDLGAGSSTVRALSVTLLPGLLGGAAPTLELASSSVKAALAPPTITYPADGGSVNTPTPTITGLAQPGATVTLVIDGGAPVTVTADGETGEWSYPVTTPLSEGGPHTVSATQTVAGEVSDPVEHTFTVDTEAPVVTISSPGEGDAVTALEPVTFTVSEEFAADSLVVSAGGVPVEGDLVENPDGSFTFTPSAPWGADGAAVEIGVAVEDLAGNPGSDAVNVTVDAEAPVVTISSPGEGDAVTALEPVTFTVSEEFAADSLVVSAGGVPVEGDLVENPDGSFTFTPSAPWGADGAAVEIGVAVEDLAGNPGSDAVNVTVDTEAPVVTITSPEDGDLIDGTTPLEFTSTEPLDLDSVVVTAGGAEVPGTTELVDGVYVFTPTGTWPEGEDVVIEVTAADPAGNEGSDQVTVDIDATGPTIEITSPTGTVPVDGLEPITFTSTEDIVLDTVEVTANGGEPVEGTTVQNPDGSYTFTPAAEWPEGEVVIEVTAFDPAGNPGSDDVTVTVDVTAPEVDITTPEDGFVTNDPGALSIGGTSVGATEIDVVVTSGATVYSGTVTPNEAGDWTVPDTIVPYGSLADGEYTVEATARDAAGNAADATPIGFTVDTTAPTIAPVITAPLDGAQLNTAGVTIEGRADDPTAETVTVWLTYPDDTTVSYTDVPVNEDGLWSLTVDALGEGDYSAVAAALDEAGNASVDSNTVGFTIDRTVAQLTITEPTPGSTTNDPQPPIRGGGGEVGATVTVVDEDGNVIGTDEVTDPTGAWEVIPTEPLEEGTYTITATQTDGAGNTSIPSEELSFTVDLTGPDLAITAPGDGALTNDTTPAIEGTVGEPENVESVTVTVTGPGEVVVWTGPATLNPDGTWFVPEGALPELEDGDYEVTAEALDGDGNTSEAGPTGFTVDATPPAPPTITEPGPGDTVGPDQPIIGDCEAGATVYVIVNGSEPIAIECDGGWEYVPDTCGETTVEVYQVDAAGNRSESSTVTYTVDCTAPAAPVITAPAAGDVVGDDTPTIVGTGEVGATVEVTIDGEVVGTTTVQPGGTWTFTPTTPLDDGPHTVSATQADEFGNTSPASEPVDFTLDTSEAAPVITSPESGTSTNNPSPTIEGTGTPGSTVTVTDGDGTVIGTDVVDEDGNWSVTPGEPLDDGQHTFTATQEDELGNVSPESNPVIITIDTVAPEAPVITSPSDGDEVTDPTPPIEGTGEPGATVEVVVTDEDGNESSYETIVDEDGTWTVTPTTPLSPGQNTIVATQTDPAGNVSPASDPIVIDVVTVTPGEGDSPLRIWIREPVVERGQEQYGIGYGFEPGETVTVTVHSTPHVLGTYTADANGEVHATWVIPANEELGEHRLEMTGAVSGSVDITFRVIEGSPAGGLATTGVDAGGTAMIALLVLMLGAGLLVGTRRLRAAHETAD